MDHGVPRTVFVLAGGGSLGATQVGMLRALTERGVWPDAVVGSSAGAINAVFLAGDPTADGVRHLEAMWRGLARQDVFPIRAMLLLRSALGHGDHLVDPAALRDLLTRHLPRARFEDLALPCVAIASDMLTGEEVQLVNGSAIDAALASAAIPLVFPPVEIDGRLLADGSIASNTPVGAAIALGATRVIVLPAGHACALGDRPRGMVAVALHALSLLTARQLGRDLEVLRDRAEIAIVPPLCPLDVSPYDFSRGGDLIDRAAAATEQWLAGGKLARREIPATLAPHTHGPRA